MAMATFVGLITLALAGADALHTKGRALTTNDPTHRTGWRFGPTLATEHRARALTRSRRAEEEDDYGIMMDAGSTGTRVYVYTWPRRSSEAVPLVKELGHDKTSCDNCGISSFAASASMDGLDASLQELIDFAQPLVPASQRKQTPIYLYATAGMRVLGYDSQDRIMSRVSAILSTSGFAFDPENVAVITGQSEAYYAWVAANFLSDTFTGSNVGVGALDLGGASTQIAAATKVCKLSECKDDTDKAVPGLLHAMFNGQRYSVYAVSFLRYGANYFNDKVLELSEESDGLQDPCLLTNTPSQYLNKTDGTASGVSGSSDPTTCAAYSTTAMKISTTEACFATGGGCDGLRQDECTCTIMGVAQPVFSTSTEFVAMSNFYNVLGRNLKVPTRDGWPDAAKQNVTDFCALEWESATERFSLAPQYLATTCQIGTQAVAMMDAYNLSGNTVRLEEAIDSVEVTWAFGAMIARANLISPYAKAGASTEEALVYGVGGAVLGWVVLCGAFFVFAIIRKRRDAVGDEAVPLTAQSSTEPNTYDS